MSQNDRIESLLKLAGERDQPSAGGSAQAREAAHAAWQRGLARSATADVPRARRPFLPWLLAAAASVLLLVAALVVGLRDAAEPVLVARVAVASGAVMLDGQPASLAAATPLMSGSELRTQNDSLALRVGDVLSLRLAARTRLRFEAPGSVTLLAGTVYVDSGGLNAPSALRIGTPAGEVRHIGTQFQVAVEGDGTRVQVREGRVVVGQPGASLIELGAGDRLSVAGGESRIERGLPGYGAAWDWAAVAAPPMDIENRPLSEFLGWYTREHGWQLRFADAGLQARSVEIRLHGSLAGLDSAGSLEYVGLITGVPLQLREGVLWAGKAP
jgi:ferric-dicitrate binding protein FerR (iron transport regulator)